MLKSAIFVLCAASCLAKFPSDIPRCKSGDSECVTRVANLIVRKYPLGRPDLGFPPFDPFTVSNFTVDEQPGRPISMKLFLKRAEIRGLAGQNFERAIGFTNDLTNTKYELYGNVPKLELVGEYRIDGRILLLPIQGDGEFHLVLEKCLGALKFKVESIEKNGLHYLKLQKVKAFIEPSSMTIKLTNLFNGNKELGDSLNEVLNKNWRDAWTELAPTVLEITGNILKDTLQPFLDKNEFDDFYLPD